MLRELGLDVVGGGACGVGHLPDLLAVGVDAGVFGLLGEAGEQVGLAGEECSPLGGNDDELVVPLRSSARWCRKSAMSWAVTRS